MKEFLSSKGVDFANKDISVDAVAREELVEKYGRMATPTLVMGERMFLGFRQNREEIEKALEESRGAANG